MSFTKQEQAHNVAQPTSHVVIQPGSQPAICLIGDQKPGHDPAQIALWLVLALVAGTVICSKVRRSPPAAHSTLSTLETAGIMMQSQTAFLLDALGKCVFTLFFTLRCQQAGLS